MTARRHRSAQELRRSRRPKVLAALVVVLSLLLGACQPEEEDDTPVTSDGEPIEITGVVGERPGVEFDTPLEIEGTTTTEVVTGDGAELAEGDVVMLSYYAVDAVTGAVLEDSYGAEPRLLQLNEDEAGVLLEELVGRTEGTRLLRLEPGSMTRPDPVVLVYDILPTRAQGTELDTPAGLPTVERAQTGEPAVTLPDGDPPASLVVQPLIRGEGEQVRSGESVTIRLVQVAWSTGETLESTWGPGSMPLTLPLLDRIQGLQEGLVDSTVGSQLMLIVPPSQADGTDTMVFVVDVLAVTSLSEEIGSSRSDSDEEDEG